MFYLASVKKKTPKILYDNINKVSWLFQLIILDNFAFSRLNLWLLSSRNGIRVLSTYFL